MSKVFLADLSKLDYPQGRTGEAAEAAIAATLPHVPGLDEALSQPQTLHVLGAHCEEQRRRFIAAHGDPFGCQNVFCSPERSPRVANQPLIQTVAGATRA